MATNDYSKRGALSPYAIRYRSLQELGFADYQAYLASQKWAQISKRILSGKECYMCGRHATVAHHTSYDVEVMDGRDDSKIFPLCHGCHSWLHDDYGTHLPADKTLGKMKNARNARLAHEVRLLDAFRKRQSPKKQGKSGGSRRRYRGRHKKARFDPSASNAVKVSAPAGPLSGPTPAAFAKDIARFL